MINVNAGLYNAGSRGDGLVGQMMLVASFGPWYVSF